ncbi:Acg family FMN-binding oxidoreductase [Actinokineospora inagensis]|uniref:Acg family FMN-binding oxidoreductase n=1 Tax=Actinokineospora inagensis TaxID=103730 RepID=UPI0004082E75|nr:nitroreductase family protein [Actinokineospora inagensis]
MTEVHPPGTTPRTGFPDRETLLTAIRMACCAPSVHNSQPWRWQVGHRAVHLWADPSRALPATDPDGRELVISCGAALHHLVVALAAFGWAARVHLLPDPSLPEHLAAVEVSTMVPEQVDLVLAAASTQRRSDRRAYAPSSVDDDQLSRLVAVAAGGVTTRVVRSPELLALIAKADAIQSADGAYRSELALWSGRVGSPDGVPAANSTTETRYGDLVTRRFSVSRLVQPTGADSAGTLLVLGTAIDDRTSWLRTGMATSAITLTATVLRLATCPLSQPVEVRETRELLRRRVLGGRVVPQLVLRLGRPVVGAEPVPRTPRRSLMDVVEFS